MFCDNPGFLELISSMLGHADKEKSSSRLNIYELKQVVMDEELERM